MSTPTTPTSTPTDANANATAATKPENSFDSIRFKDGVIAKGKLIGVEDVKEETGDETCNTSMVKLKAVVVAKREHKLPILIKISYDGVHILDAKTNEVLYHHPVDRISYIARDPNDARAFGYIFRNAKYELQYIAIKTERQSSEVVLTLKDLFEDVYEQKKAKRDQAKKEAAAAANPNATSELVEQPTQPVISGNIFDLDEQIPPPPTPQNTPSQSTQDTQQQQQQYQQPIPNINPPPPQSSIINSPPGYAAQLSTSPTLMPIEASPKTDVLSLFDTLQSSSNTNSTIQKSASNADMLNSLNFSPTAEQSSADRLNSLKQQIGNLQQPQLNLSGNSSLGTSPNPFGLRAPPGPPQSLPGSYGGSPNPNPNPFGAGQYGSLSPQPQTNMYGQPGFPQYATSPMQQQQQQQQFPQFNAYQQPQQPGPYQPQPQPQYSNQQFW